MNPSAHESELRPLTAVGLVDRSVAMARTVDRSELLRAFVPSVLLSALAIALFVVERVEGIRSLRWAFAIGIVLAHSLRAVWLARFAGRCVEHMLRSFGLQHQHGSTSTIVRTNLWMALDLWAWSWLLVLAVRIDPWLFPAVLPLFAFRALIAPSWLCDADHGDASSGFGVLRAALDKGDGQRARAVLAELFLLLGAIGIALNLGAFAAVAVSTGQDILGLDLSFVRAFLSPENHFALLVIACVSLSLVDPLRAIIAAQLYVEHRLVRDGLLVRSLVERCAQAGPRGAWMLGLFLGSSLWISPAAQADEVDAGVEAECDVHCERAHHEDDLIAQQAAEILEDPVFAEFPNEALFGNDEHREPTFSKWIEDLLRWLFELGEDEKNQINPEQNELDLPGPVAFALVALGIAVLAVVSLLLQTRTKAKATIAPPEEIDPFDVAAEDHLRAADELASRDVRAALRALYLAALVRLGRRGLITLSHERTNGMYLRELKGLTERSTFLALTRIFERVVYGNIEPTSTDYSECRSLAERLRDGEDLSA